MTQKSRPGRCFLLSVPCHSRSRKRFILPSSFVAGFVFLQHIGWGLGGRYHGWDLDALAERMGCGWTILWLGPGCSGRTDGIWVDDIMVGPGCSGRTDAVWVDDIMVGTWMLWQNGWGLGGRYHGWDLDALAERMGSGWTISWLGPGCSGRNGWGLGGRYHDWDLDALAERMRSGWDDIMVGTWMLWPNGWGLGGRYHDWELGCSGSSDGVWCPKLRGSRTWAGGRDRGGKKGWANDQVAA